MDGHSFVMRRPRGGVQLQSAQVRAGCQSGPAFKELAKVLYVSVATSYAAVLDGSKVWCNATKFIRRDRTESECPLFVGRHS